MSFPTPSRRSSRFGCTFDWLVDGRVMSTGEILRGDDDRWVLFGEEVVEVSIGASSPTIDALVAEVLNPGVITGLGTTGGIVAGCKRGIG